MTLRSSIEEELVKNGRLIYSNVGDSMLPFIKQGRDLLLITRPAEWDTLPQGSLTKKLKKYDVPLYKRDGGSVYVLHRVAGIDGKGYVLCGDNRRHKEHGITDKNIAGVLSAVIRNGREIQVTDPKYRIFVHLWCYLFPLRAIIIFIRDRSRKAGRKRLLKNKKG